MSQINPALSAKEWRQVESDRSSRNPDAPVFYTDNGPPSEMSPFKWMAICNFFLPDGDPRKITHAHVEGLRRCVAHAELLAAQNLPPGQPTAIRADTSLGSELATMLEALLPPR